MKTALYQIRIDPQEKQETFAVFDELGISPAQAIRLFFAQVRRTHAIPFQSNTLRMPQRQSCC